MVLTLTSDILSCCNFTVIIIARKRCLGQGNIFRSMCHSVLRGEGEVSLYDVTSCLAARSHAPSGGLCSCTHFPSRGRAGGSLSRGVSVKGDRDLPRGHWMGRYASHWNLYLFHDIDRHMKCTLFLEMIRVFAQVSGFVVRALLDTSSNLSMSV